MRAAYDADMDLLTVRGGRPLGGEVAIYGSKNAATKLMIASLLSDEPSVLRGMPFSADVDITRELCERIGSRVVLAPDRTCRIETPEVLHPLVPELSRKNRIPILALGPLLHRKGVAEVPVLGGCPIGHRPVNFHLAALQKMGAVIERRDRSYFARADELRGADISFEYPSVGATENVLLAATLARGTTRIENAAVEPEILNLIEMLRRMGARIDAATERRTIVVEGVRRLGGAEIDVIPDRNEIVSFAAAALATDGDVFMPGVGTEHLGAFLDAVGRAGGRVAATEAGVRFSGERPYRPIEIATGPHPGFMTDWQQPFCVLLTQADGTSIIHETVYEDRLGYTNDLRRMGAAIEVGTECAGTEPCRFSGFGYAHTARIAGPAKLRGSEIAITDIRAGMAHLVAALAAEGASTIRGVEHLDRGYEKIDERLRKLGADIERVGS